MVMATTKAVAVGTDDLYLDEQAVRRVVEVIERERYRRWLAVEYAVLETINASRGGNELAR